MTDNLCPACRPKLGAAKQWWGERLCTMKGRAELFGAPLLAQNSKGKVFAIQEEFPRLSSSVLPKAPSMVHLPESLIFLPVRQLVNSHPDKVVAWMAKLIK